MITKPRFTHIILSLVICLHISAKSFFEHLLSKGRSEEKPFWERIFSYLSENEGITIGDYVGHGTFGVVVKGKRVFKDNNRQMGTVEKSYDMGFKLMKIDKELDCTDMDIADKLTKAGAKYTLGLFYRRAFAFTEPEFNLFCVLGIELGTQSLESAIFSDIHDKETNTHAFIEIVYKILSGFKTMNFDARYLHGDVKPANMILSKVGNVLEPRIIDFDYTFQPHMNIDASRKRKPRWILYTLDFRAPEIRRLCPQNNCSRQELTNYKSNYRFDTLYREDAYAIGVSLNKIYVKNKNAISKTDPIVLALKNIIIPKMMHEDPYKRWTTYEALIEMKDILKENEFQLTPMPDQALLKELSNRTELKETVKFELTQGPQLLTEVPKFAKPIAGLNHHNREGRPSVNTGIGQFKGPISDYPNAQLYNPPNKRHLVI